MADIAFKRAGWLGIAALASAIILGLPISRARGATISVSPGDSTLSIAMRAASPGDSLVLKPGTYVQYEVLYVKAGVVVTSLAGPNATVVKLYPYLGALNLFIVQNVSPPPMIDGLTIAHGWDASGEGGAGILVVGSDPEIRNNLLVANSAGDLEGGSGHGAAIGVYYGQPTIEHNTIVANFCDFGAVDLYRTLATVQHNLICYTSGNDTLTTGMGMSCYQSPSAVVRENLFWKNALANIDSLCSQVLPADGNLVLDPKFCHVVRDPADPLVGDWRVEQGSPAAPGGVASGWGAPLGVCPGTAAVPTTWGKLKSVYRR